MSPEDYDLQGRDLVRFDTGAVLRVMKPEARARFEENLMAGKFLDALDQLRNCFQAVQALRKQSGSGCPEELYRVRLCDMAYSGLRGAIDNPQREGAIHALPRNPYTGNVTIAGSSIKGAIRTALLNEFVNPGGRADETIHNLVAQAKREGKTKAALVLEEKGFNCLKRATEEDVMRMVEVADAEWPASEVVVSHAIPDKVNREEGATQGMQLHLERLRCMADGAKDLPSCELRIQINLEAQKDPRVRLGRKVNWALLSNACNRFFAERFAAETQRFRPLFGERISWMPDMVEGDILLRVGRHCHFDSLSVNGLREGWNAAANAVMTGMGYTRTMCELESGKRAPFGWVLLRRKS